MELSSVDEVSGRFGRWLLNTQTLVLNAAPREAPHVLTRRLAGACQGSLTKRRRPCSR